MEARMKNPALLVPGAQESVFALHKAIGATGVEERVLELVHLRVSQINGCAACVFGGIPKAKRGGETEDRLHSVAVWRESPLFTDAERAALRLAEAMTRIADRPESVSDEVWGEAEKHFGEKELAGLVLMVGMVNMFNRFNVTTRQIAGPTW